MPFRALLSHFGEAGVSGLWAESHSVTFLNSFLALVSFGERLGPEQDVSQGAMEMAH